MRLRARLARRAGFTLLETVIALAILSMALMAIFDLNAGAIASHSYTKRLTVASLLARSKMTDLEQQLYDDGLPPDDDEESGDFSEEGWPSFKWRARILAPQTDQVTPDQLLSSMFGMPLGEGGIAGLLGGMGGAAGAAAGAAGAGGGTTDPAGMLAMLGPMAGMAQTQVTQMLQQVSQTVREVHLTVSWKDGTQVESIDVVTHVVSLGPGSDRNGNTTGQAGANQGADSGYVDSLTGAPVPNPVKGANGAMTNPATGNPAIPASQFRQQAQGAGAPQLGNPQGLQRANPARPGFPGSGIFNPLGNKRPPRSGQ